jgi:hypothetical protein
MGDPVEEWGCSPQLGSLGIFQWLLFSREGKILNGAGKEASCYLKRPIATVKGWLLSLTCGSGLCTCLIDGWSLLKGQQWSFLRDKRPFQLCPGGAALLGGEGCLLCQVLCP